MRLIDADHFLKTLWKVVREEEDETWSKIADALRFMVESEATFCTIDAVPVVRCKECKQFKWLETTPFTKPLPVCKRAIGCGYIPTKEDGYCADGERRDDGRNKC